MFQQVIGSLSSFGRFSEEDMALITGRLKPVKLKKGDRLIAQGQVCQKFCYVDSGSFRHYQLLETGDEAVLNLYIEKDWICEYKSFMAQKPSETVIQAAEDSVIFELSIHDFHELVKLSDGFFRMGRILEQAIQGQDYQNTRIAPEEKYELLLAARPQVIQKFSLKNIASYLGMTPETLSRVRRRLIS